MISKFKALYSVVKKKYFKANFSVYKGFRKVDLLIFDDLFPHPVSGFRYEEFKVCLSEFSNSKIITSSAAYPIVKTPVAEHKKHIADFFHLNKELRGKLQLKKGMLNINAKLFYCIFLNTVFRNLKWLEKYKIPFVFTLYPGGGFQIDGADSDRKLTQIFNSPMFRKVIVTQLFTKDYLLKKGLCKSENIEFIFGGVVPQSSLKKETIDKKRYGKNKATFDICFCAAKYTPRGEDKGYDVFIDFAHKIAAEYDFVRFHVIGGFDEKDIDVSAIKDKIHFYGYQSFEFLGLIFKNMDVLLSPNKSFVLNKGAFDGFPLGTVIEAALNGVVALITDDLKQNTIFIPNEDLIIIESDSSSIQKEIIDLINQPEKLYLISEKGKKKFSQVYSNEVQMKPRIELLKKEILKNNDNRN